LLLFASITCVLPLIAPVFFVTAPYISYLSNNLEAPVLKLSVAIYVAAHMECKIKIFSPRVQPSVNAIIDSTAWIGIAILLIGSLAAHWYYGRGFTAIPWAREAMILHSAYILGVGVAFVTGLVIVAKGIPRADEHAVDDRRSQGFVCGWDFNAAVFSAARYCYAMALKFFSYTGSLVFDYLKELVYNAGSVCGFVAGMGGRRVLAVPRVLVDEVARVVTTIVALLLGGVLWVFVLARFFTR
jgi:hypothetical protein